MEDIAIGMILVVLLSLYCMPIKLQLNRIEDKIKELEKTWNR